MLKHLILSTTGCSPQNGTQVGGCGAVAVWSNRLKLGDRNVEGFSDTPTKYQENR